MAARGRGRGTGRSRRGWGGPAHAHAGRGGGRAGARFPPAPGRQRAATAAATDGQDPTRARARAPERETRPGEGRRPPRRHTTPPPGRRRRQTRMGGRSGPGKRQAHRGAAPGQQPDGRRATRRLSGEGLGAGNRKSSGGKDRGPPRGGSGTLQRRLRARGRPPGHTGSHRPRPPAQGRSRGTRGCRPGPRRALATSRGSGHNHHATVTTGPQNALPHAQQRQPPCTLLDQRPSSRGAESTSPGDDHPPKAVAAGEGTTPNSGEAGFGPKRADRGHDVPSAIWSRRARRGWVGGDGEGAQSGRGPGARGGSGSGEGRAPTKTRTGPPGKRARDPTATSMRAVPRRPGRRPASAPLAGPPPREPGPTTAGTQKPHVTPAAGAQQNLRPSVWSIPESRPRGSNPQARAARPVPARHPRRQLGTGAGGRQPLARHGEAGRAGAPHPSGDTAPRGSGRTRTRTHAGAPRAGRRPGPAGSSPDSEGGGAGRGRQRAALGPAAGPADPSRRGGSAQHATVVTPHRWPLRAEEGRQLGGSGTPRHPLGSLEKAFSPRAHRPHPFVPRPGPAKRLSKGRQGLGGRG